MLQVSGRRRRRFKNYTEMPFRAPSLGHLLLPDINVIPIGHTLRTMDVDLDQPGAVISRKGIEPLGQNPIGAKTILDFNVGFGWALVSGGTTSFGFDSDFFRFFESSGPGRRSFEMFAGPNETCLVRRASLPNEPLDLGSDLDEYICWSLMKPLSLTQPNSTFKLTLEDSAAVKSSWTTPAGDLPAGVTVEEWTFYAIRKRDFTSQAINWRSIKAAEMEFFNDDNSGGTKVINIDNIFKAPKWVDGLYNFRKSEKAGGGSWILGCAGGVLSYFDRAQSRWRELLTGLVPDEPVNFVTFNDVCSVLKASDDVRIVLSDGEGGLVAHLSGIKAPTSEPKFELLVGEGELPSGTPRYRIVFFSTITGQEGNSIDVESTVASGGGDAIRLTGLPQSNDPKVNWGRIYRKDATAQRYRRCSDSPDGEYHMGETAFTDTLGLDDLGAELTGFPSYLENSPPPRARFGVQVGNRLLLAGNPDAPGTVYASQQDSGERWDIVAGTERLNLSDNDEITGLSKAWGHALAGKFFGWHIGTPIAGSRHGFFWQERTGSQKAGHGPVSHRSIVVLEDVVRYRSWDGYYEMDQAWNIRAISEGWKLLHVVPGLLEPSFQQFTGSGSQYLGGAYHEPRAQVVWTDQLKGDQFPKISPVFHVGHLKGLLDPGPSGTWVFHRYLLDHDLSGFTSIANFVDDQEKKIRVMIGGRAGFVYTLDSNEWDDKIVDEDRIPVDSDILIWLSHPGAAFGPHHLKDYVWHDLFWRPLGNWPVDLTYYYHWSSNPYHTTSVTPIPPDDISLADLTVDQGPFYASTNFKTRVDLPGVRTENLMVRVRNNRLGQAFHLSAHTLWAQWITGEAR